MALYWYAIQTYFGSEQAVKRGIENLVREHHLEERITDIVVPTEDIIEVKNNKKKISEAKSQKILEFLSKNFKIL